jgi:hypothetical protein
MKICLSAQPQRYWNGYIQRGHAEQFVLIVNTGFFSTSAAIATVVFTGLVMIPMQAAGRFWRSAVPGFSQYRH